jgi:hypothetical protein
MIVVGVIGVPGTGKSTLLKRWMQTRNWVYEKPIKLLDSHFDGDGIRVLGKYEPGELFCGTDKMSMAVQPMAIQYLHHNNDRAVIFEGDRLTSVNFFQAAIEAGHELHIIELTTSHEERESRYQKRGSNQSESFIKGRATKISNIHSKFIVDKFDHTHHYQTDLIVDHINRIISQTQYGFDN